MINRTKLSLFFALAAFLIGGNPSVWNGAVSASGLIKPAATTTPTPTPTAPPPAEPTKTPVGPTKTPQTLGSLQSFIAGRLSRPEVRRGRVGVKIVSLNTGKTVYEQDGDRYFMPASNMKNFTVATAMEKLGPDYKFVTSVFAPAAPDTNGVIKGNLRIYGRGDVSISTAFFGTSPSDPETYYKGIDRLVDKIAAAGVKKVEGNIVGDESYFKGFYIPSTWEWDDLQWYYGADVSALPINDNAVDIAVLPGKTGGACVVSISPPNALFQVVNKCWTMAAGIGAKRELSVNKLIDRNIIEISGTVPGDDSGFRSSITVTHPSDLFVAILKERLAKHGIEVTGQTSSINRDWYISHSVQLPARGRPTSFPTERGSFIVLSQEGATPAERFEIAKLESPSFGDIAAKTMKPSQNMYTETILRTLGEWLREKDEKETISTGRGPTYTGKDSSEIGLAAVRDFLTEIGIPQDAVLQYDGCGMSRHDQITPSAVVALYSYMAKQSRNAQAWRDSLSIGGEDGTLRTRFKGTRAAGNIRGKTGTIDQVSALSGYMATAGGEPVILSIIVNGVPEGRLRTSLIDDITVAVANFDGKIDQ